MESEKNGKGLLSFPCTYFFFKDVVRFRHFVRTDNLQH